MKRKGRLIAGATVSGAVLCLNLSASGHTLDGKDTAVLLGEKTLPSRIEDLRKKLNSGISLLTNDGKEKTAVENIVQFFNFFNCHRGRWKNC